MSLWKSIRKYWLRTILVVLIVGEFSLIFTESAQMFTTAYNYGTVHYGCPNLQGSIVRNDSTVRWVFLTCPNGPALVDTPSSPGWAHGLPPAILLPTFAPPPGLLGIYTIGPSYGKCPNPDQGNPGISPPMISGVSVVAFDTGLNYCAALTGPAGTLSGFIIHWTVGNGRPYTVSNSMELFAPDVTVARGQNATLRLTVKSLQSFSENVSFQVGFPLNTANNVFTPSTYFKPLTLLLGPGSSNSTLVTLQVSPAQPPGNYQMTFTGVPVYGLRFYGDYQAT